MYRSSKITVWCFFLVAVVVNVFCNHQVYGQAGLRESLERLDRDEDGNISPDEITPLARPYLERVAKARRISLDRPNPIDKWQEAARIYHAFQNGVAGSRVSPEGESSVKAFGPTPDEPLVPEFGLAEVKYPYLLEDLEQADQTLRRCDRNRDGYVDRSEAVHNRWTHRDPFEMDLDKDDRLSRLELGQRYARRRLLSGASSELVQKAWRTGNGIRPSDSKEEASRSDSRSSRRGGSQYYLTATIFARFDLNRNGRLELLEVTNLGIAPGQIDVDRDGELSRQELFAYLSPLQEEVGGLSEIMPSWFYELDADHDQQISMIEFVQEWTQEKVEEFMALDTNEDGLLTSTEIVSSITTVGGSYSNEVAEVLGPGKTVISEIEVSDDFPIGDLNVQLSITHTYASQLDAYLTGPDGTRVELFTEVGGSDDHFDRTVFDDQSRYPITKARPPFKGTFMPEALLKRQPSLSHFNGTSVKGVWQLVVRCSRSERFGMLHSWSLVVEPQDDMLESTAAVAVPDGSQQEPIEGVDQPSSEEGVPAQVESGGKAFEKYRAYIEKMRLKGKEFLDTQPADEKL